MHNLHFNEQASRIKQIVLARVTLTIKQWLDIAIKYFMNTFVDQLSL